MIVIHSYLSLGTIGYIRSCIVFRWISDQFISKDSKYVTYGLISLIMIEGLSVFRCFKPTRYYIRLILNSIQDVLPFIIIFLYTTFSFGTILSVYKDVSMSEIWINTYDINIGLGLHSSSFDKDYVLFLIASIINFFIVLNLLISILGDSFDHFQVNADIIDLLEMAEAISGVETIASFKELEDFSKCEYLIGIIPLENINVLRGKVTKQEFNPMNQMVLDIKNILLERLDDSEKKLSRIEDIQNNLQNLFKLDSDIKNTLYMTAEQSEKNILSKVEELIENSHSSILKAIELNKKS